MGKRNRTDFAGRLGAGGDGEQEGCRLGESIGKQITKHKAVVGQQKINSVSSLEILCLVFIFFKTLLYICITNFHGDKI